MYLLPLLRPLVGFNPIPQYLSLRLASLATPVFPMFFYSVVSIVWIIYVSCKSLCTINPFFIFRILFLAYSLDIPVKHWKLQCCYIFSGKARLLLSQIAGVKPTFLNDLDIDSNGVIYISDSCRKWQRREFMYPCLEGTGSGRCDWLSTCTSSLSVTGNIGL